MRRASGGLALALVLVCGTAWGQQPAPALKTDAGNGTVTFDVVVTDKAGQPIGGLQQSDFQLLDDGHPAQIQAFHAFSAADDAQEPPQIILLVDAVNASFVAVSNARGQIENFLRSNQGKLPAQVSVAYLTDDGIEETGHPTTDGTALADLLHSRQGELRAIRRSSGFYGAVERMQMSLKSLRLLASHESQVPGRKLLIWISPGWPIFDNPNIVLSIQDERGIFNSVVQLSNQLRQAQMTIDMVDPLGTFDAGSMRTFLWQDFVKPISKPSQASPGDLALQVVATQSGGRALSGSNDVAGEIAQCARDVNTWYRISFDAERGKEGPTWHSVTVKVDHPGTKVRTRNGYYAEP